MNRAIARAMSERIKTLEARLEALEQPRKLRRGLAREVHDAFELALDMTGSFHPDAIDPERERLRRLRAEVLRALRGKP